MRTQWNFYTAGQLEWGWGCVAGLGRQLERRKLSRVLVVTDPILVQAGIVERIRGPLRESSIEHEVFAGGCAEPSIAVALEAYEAAKKFRPDAILGLGGGSNMDLAKIVAILQAHGGHPRDYFNFDRVPGPVTPLICVPTTSGTGSEVSHAAVLTDTDQHLKVSTLSNWLRPNLAVVDPELTLSCPPKVTADSGIDALTHAIEALTARDFSDFDCPSGGQLAYEGHTLLGEILAERAIGLVGQHLARAVADGKDRAAREGMSLAATLAGMAFSNCAVAVVHALEYPLGGAVHVSHGAGNGLLLPYVMRFNLPAREAEFARIAQLLGADTAGKTSRAAAEGAIDAVFALRRAIGIPDKLRELGVTEAMLPILASKAFAIKRLMNTNPRQPTEEDLLGILKEAF